MIKYLQKIIAVYEIKQIKKKQKKDTKVLFKKFYSSSECSLIYKHRIYGTLQYCSLSSENC